MNHRLTQLLLVRQQILTQAVSVAATAICPTTFPTPLVGYAMEICRTRLSITTQSPHRLPPQEAWGNTRVSWCCARFRCC